MVHWILMCNMSNESFEHKLFTYILKYANFAHLHIPNLHKSYFFMKNIQTLVFQIAPRA